MIAESSVEVIIADSPDTLDDTQKYVQRNYITYFTTVNRGRAKQMNEAVAKSRGSILMFLHADVRPPFTFVRDISDAVAQGYTFGFFSYRFSPSSFMLAINASFTRKNGLFAGGGDQIQFMIRDLFEQMGGYDENFCIMEDFDFVRRFRKSGKPLIVIKNPAVVSSRKYKNNSWLKVNMLNLTAFIMFWLRIAPHKIRDIYYGQMMSKDS